MPDAAAANVTATWNLVRDVRQLFDFPFMTHAIEAGTIVAVTAAVVGWFMTLRRQTFAGHTVAVVGFPGAAGATLLGISATAGYFTFCIAAALVIAALPHAAHRSFSEESAVTGALQAFLLACGFLFSTLYRGNLSGVYSYLFGSFLGITATQVQTLLLIALAALAVVVAIGRPLFFASVDPDVAAARGAPVRALGVVFLVLLGVAAAETSEITGSLLVFALLVMPAATARQVTARPGAGLALSIGVALVVTWLGLGVAYYSPYPIGFFVTTFAFAAYVASRGATVVRSFVARRQRVWA